MCEISAAIIFVLLFVFNMQISLHFRNLATNLQWRKKPRNESESPLIVYFLINAHSKVNLSAICSVYPFCVCY